MFKGRSGKAKGIASLAGLAAALLLAGCAASPLRPDNWDYSRAEKTYEKGEFERALGLYNSLERRPSQEFRRDTILFRMGECYLKLNSPAEARRVFVDLKKTYPDTDYRIDVNQRLSGLAEKGEQIRTATEKERAEAERRLETARESLRAGGDRLGSAEKAQWLVQAAEALWDLERYEDARDVYVEAMNTLPRLRTDSRITGRLRIPEDAGRANVGIVAWLAGQDQTFAPLDPRKVIPLTPLATDVNGGQSLLQVFNTTLRWERVKEDPRARYAVVTGQVKNVTAHRVSGASVEVILTGIGFRVYDTGYAQVRALGPEDTTSFRVRLGPFDDSENVFSYSTRVLADASEAGE